jgi:simple sugar transport system substrate-binding protein
MVAAGAKRLFCLNHNPGVTSLTQRCDGFKTAVSKSGTAQFVAEVDVNATNQGEYIAAVEAAVGESGAWTGVGIILTGSIQAPLGLQLLAAHSNALIATFDTAQVIFNALQSGEYLFAINQQPYFQGYLPIPLLTAKIQANRQLLNFFLHWKWAKILD